jgi:hypothetical protein
MQKRPGVSGVITSEAKLRGELTDGLVRRTREARIREREKTNLNRSPYCVWNPQYNPGAHRPD